MIVGGTAFFWPVDNHQHLRFVISEPEMNKQEVVHVNVTTYRPKDGNKIRALKDARNDPACIICCGEHPFFDKPMSCAFYAGTKCSSLDEIETKVNRGVWSLHDTPASPELLKKLRYGAITTGHLEQQYADILLAQGLIV